VERMKIILKLRRFILIVTLSLARYVFLKSFIGVIQLKNNIQYYKGGKSSLVVSLE
jgi:hypothetical protein